MFKQHKWRIAIFLAVIVVGNTWLSRQSTKKPAPDFLSPYQLDAFVAVVVADNQLQGDEAGGLRWAEEFIARKDSRQWEHVVTIKQFGKTGFVFRLSQDTPKPILQ